MDFLYFSFLQFIFLCSLLFRFSSSFEFVLLFFLLPHGLKLWYCFKIFLPLWMFIVTSLPFSTAFTTSHKFHYVLFLLPTISRYFSKFSCDFFFPLAQCLLFNFHILVTFPVFFLLWISSFIPLWSENILYGILVLLNLLRLIL